MGPIYHVSQRGRSSVENSALHPVSGAKCSNHYLFVHSLPLLLANVVVFHQNDGPTVTCPIMRRLSKSYQMFFSFFVSRFSFCYALPIGRERKICGAPVLVRLQSPVWAAALAAGWLAGQERRWRNKWREGKNLPSQKTWELSVKPKVWRYSSLHLK